MTNASMKALRDASPRNHPDFDAFLERHEGLKAQITSTPPGFAQRSRPPARHRRLISLSAAVTAAAALAVFVGSLMLGGPSPQSAYAAAKKAIVATAAASSGTITGSLSHDGSSYRLETTRWNGDSISVTRGDMSQFGPNQALLLIDGGAYVEEANGTWLHFASASGVGPKVGPEVELAQNNVVGNPASQVLSLATGLTQTHSPTGPPFTPAPSQTAPPMRASIRTTTQSCAPSACLVTASRTTRPAYREAFTTASSSR